MAGTATDQANVAVAIEGALGVITLDRPGAINALTREMVNAVAGHLRTWRSDDRVRAVLFEGRGERGFCAGGDVRAVRDLVLAGRPEEAHAFFADEYRMNALIAGYPKPVVALCHGAVMGGGIGIAGHADFRLAVPDVRFAMPEAAIGFVCDVGVNAILARAAPHRALLFELSGLAVGPADALALGLTDCIVAADRRAAVRAGIAAAASAPDVETALVGLMETEGIEVGDGELCATADRLADALGEETAAEVVSALRLDAAGDTELGSIAETIAGRCPTSLAAILMSHRRARLLQDMEPVLALDLRLARYMSVRPDFAEGVRAVLVDKDRRARWSPEAHESVDTAAIAALVSAPTEAPSVADA